MLSDKDIGFLVAAKQAKVALQSGEEKLGREEDKLDTEQKLLTSYEASKAHQKQVKVNEARRSISDVYDVEIDKISKSIQQEEKAKSKSRAAQVEARIAAYNENLIIQKQGFYERIDSLSKAGNVTIKSKNKFYFMLLIPRGFKECLIAASVSFIALIVVLLSINYFAPPAYHWLYFIGFAVIYSLVHAVKTNYVSRNLKFLTSSRSIYDEIAKIDKVISANANKIKEDRDDSMYDLDEFNQRLHMLQSKLSEQLNEKDRVLNDFDTNKAKKIEADIEELFKDKIFTAQEKIEELQNSIQKLTDENYKLKKYTTITYDNVLGNEYNSVKRIDELMNVMKRKNILDVESAIQAYENDIE